MLNSLLLSFPLHLPRIRSIMGRISYQKIDDTCLTFYRCPNLRCYLIIALPCAGGNRCFMSDKSNYGGVHIG